MPGRLYSVNVYNIINMVEEGVEVLEDCLHQQYFAILRQFIQVV